MADRPLYEGAVIEIVERRRSKPDGERSLGDELVVPSHVRINGHYLLLDEGGVTIHETNVPAGELVRVTLTLLARRVVIEHEDIEAKAEASNG